MCSKSKERTKDETISVKDSTSKNWQKSEINEPLEETNINNSLNTNFDKFLVPFINKKSNSEQNNNNDDLSGNEKQYSNAKTNKIKEIEENFIINNFNVLDKSNIYTNNNDIFGNNSRKNSKEEELHINNRIHIDSCNKNTNIDKEKFTFLYEEETKKSYE